MSHDFVTELRLQLREAALREERRGPLRRALAPLPGPAAAVALAVALIALVVVIGGLQWDRGERQAAPRVVATFPLADSLGQIGAGFGAVWAADTAKDRILRVDPRSRRLVTSIRVGERLVLNVGAGAVWAMDARRRLVRIDPRTNRITARTQLPSDLGLPDIQIIRGVPWVTATRGALRIDPETAKVVDSVRVPGGDPRWVVAADDGLWALTRDARLLRFDLATGRSSAELPVRLPGASAFTPTDAGPVLVTPDGQIARASLTDGRLAWRRKLASGFSGPPMQIGDTLWLHAVAERDRDRLLALDLTSGETRSATTLPEFGATGAARVGRELWITTPNGKVMVVRP